MPGGFRNAIDRGSWLRPGPLRRSPAWKPDPRAARWRHSNRKNLREKCSGMPSQDPQGIRPYVRQADQSKILRRRDICVAPVLDRKPGNIPNVSDVACCQGEAMYDRGGSNEQVEICARATHRLHLLEDTAINIRHQLIYWKRDQAMFQHRAEVRPSPLAVEFVESKQHFRLTDCGDTHRRIAQRHPTIHHRNQRSLSQRL